ncbi:hypothetical protein FE661_10800 [Acidithiobacillus ferrooxidans]|uniref:relaxase/mobilization nuclease domain-containing protein n=2 Tax=Acidithiobacillus ferrooxidans TaxID=920 RepID=UPI0015DD4A99|nr:relaxase/mobilization nuclease domain-containing protein [Acidithiobacillus ferrooxidans]MCR1344150.1 relaxase/mobilization nuclease domain-containing protein [Acidithiobacillus ferrooxidans]QLK42595.1 hypothetical protein FE661_10800 [Acidithiobacillus ferrooxidans]
MIEKIRKGKGARGLAEYLLASKDHNGDLRPRADIIGGTLAGRNPRELAAEIGMLRRMRPNLQTAVGHVSLRVPEGDRPLSDQEWAAIGDRWAQEMGMDSYCTVCHGDHVHIMFSRINSDGSVVSDSHDYRRGEAAVRKIEQEFGLVQVEPSHLLEPERALNHRKAPKKGDFIAMEKGEIPARLFVQGALDAVLAKRPTATQLIADMEALGIVIEPNVATTGKLSGFAYHFGHYRFTSAALGRGYTMGNMQKKGFTYEPDRDLEAIRAAKDRAESFFAGRRAGDDTPSAGHEAGVGAVARSDRATDRPGVGTIGQVGQDAGPAPIDHPAADRSGDQTGAGADRWVGTRQSAAGGGDGAGAASESQRSKPSAEGLDGRSEDVTDAKGRDAGADSAAHIAVLDSNRVGGDAGRGLGADDFGEVPVMAWDTRFKQASARKRGKSQNDERQADRQAEYRQLVEAAHMADLVVYMKGLGLDVQKDAVKDYVVDDRYRVTRKQDGHFVWCSWDQSRGGDTIAFCTEELGLSFQQALADLAGEARLIQTKPREISHVDRFPSSPPTSRDPDLVLQYLEDRGISQSIIRHAQGAGFLRFVDYAGTPGVAFCGYDPAHHLRSMAVRLVRPIQSWDGQKEITKIDVRHSDKSYPAIFRGGDPILPSNRSLWIVEGGTDGLAVLDWYRAAKIAAPGIIVSGGDGVRAFLDRPHVQSLVGAASTVYVALEREKSQKTQIKTDAAHQRQIQKIQGLGLGCGEVVAWRPPVGSKDVADAWKAGALPDAHDPLAHVRQGGGSAPMPTSAPTSTSTFRPE